MTRFQVKARDKLADSIEASGRISVKDTDPRLHVYETLVRSQVIDFSGVQNVTVEVFRMANMLAGQ